MKQVRKQQTRNKLQITLRRLGFIASAVFALGILSIVSLVAVCDLPMKSLSYEGTITDWMNQREYSLDELTNRAFDLTSQAHFSALWEAMGWFNATYNCDGEDCTPQRLHIEFEAVRPHHCIEWDSTTLVTQFVFDIPSNHMSIRSIEALSVHFPNTTLLDYLPLDTTLAQIFAQVGSNFVSHDLYQIDIRSNGGGRWQIDFNTLAGDTFYSTSIGVR